MKGGVVEWYRLKRREAAQTVDSRDVPHVFRADLNNPETVYFVDGGTPHAIHFKAQCFLYASPQKNNQRDVHKVVWGYRRFIMPLWSEQELLDCFSAVEKYSSLLDEGKVKGLFWAAGGVARTVLARPVFDCHLTPARLAAELDAHVAKLTINELQALQREIDVDSYFPPGSDCMLHWNVQDAQDWPKNIKNPSPEDKELRKYTKQYTQLASPWIAASICVHYMRNLAELCASFIITHRGHYETAAAVGHQFERLAHALLAAGGTWPVKLLGDNQGPSRYNLHLPANSSVKAFERITEAADLAAADMSNYLMPIVKDWPGIDSIRSPALMFQITVASSHSLVVTKRLRHPPVLQAVMELPIDNSTIVSTLTGRHCCSHGTRGRAPQP